MGQYKRQTEPCYSKYGPRTSGNRISWDLVRNVESQTLPALLVRICIFNKTRGGGWGFIYTLQFVHTNWCPVFHIGEYLLSSLV